MNRTFVMQRLGGVLHQWVIPLCSSEKKFPSGLLKELWAGRSSGGLRHPHYFGPDFLILLVLGICCRSAGTTSLWVHISTNDNPVSALVRGIVCPNTCINIGFREFELL